MRNTAWANYIRRARNFHGLANHELAARAGIDPSYITLIERDGYVPRRDKVLVLAKALGLQTQEALLIAGYAPTDIAVNDLLAALAEVKGGKRAEIFAAISAERERQNSLHPPPPDMWQALAVLTKEVGEVAKAIIERKPEEVREELIQVAAVAVRALEDVTILGENGSNQEKAGGRA